MVGGLGDSLEHQVDIPERGAERILKVVGDAPHEGALLIHHGREGAPVAVRGHGETHRPLARAHDEDAGEQRQRHERDGEPHVDPLPTSNVGAHRVGRFLEQLAEVARRHERRIGVHARRVEHGGVG